MSVWLRAKEALSLNHYATISTPEEFCKAELTCPEARQYILRMMVESPETGVRIPDTIEWLRPLILRCRRNQNLMGIRHPYCYVTVRHGEVTSETDDAWHVDGFSMRISHLPEQNYICSSSPATEFLTQSFQIPTSFDPLKHNLHWYFQDRADEANVAHGKPNLVYLIDPYVIHRRPKVDPGIIRTFFRISFVPIEIRDDRNTQNPMMPNKLYGTVDFRTALERF